MNTINLVNEKETGVLALLACNVTIKESAKHLEISERTVDYYRSRLKCRFGALSSNDLINQIIVMDEYEALIRLGRIILSKSSKTPGVEKKRLAFNTF